MTTKITEQNISNISNAAVQWQTVVTADGSTATSAVAGYGYFIDTTSAAHTVNLPNTANVGDTIILKDYAGTWGTNNVTISSTLKISGADADGTLSTNNTTVTIVYMDTTKGWTSIQNSTQGALAVDQTFISATGGTVTTSGDYKIHTFTGDGCFVVSSLGGGIPCAQASTVDYLVVAGGGAGTGDRGGGGGAGGYRMSASLEAIPGSPGAPLANPTGITISATTYPITVGAGGTAPATPTVRGNQGSNSVFSTITSAGGGEGGGGPSANAGNGGSGGGSRDTLGGTGGSGNTPPTSPPQGQNGQPYNPTGDNAGFGGGGVGGGGSLNDGGPGAGIPSSFGTTGEPSGGYYYYAGGGGGGGNGPGTTVGTGGIGGGGNGGPPSPGAAPGGDANTGGGGGGGGNGPGTAHGGSGGKGIVVIKYKYQ